MIKVIVSVIAAACASSASAQALSVWEARYEAAQRTTSISLQSIPRGGAAANAGSFSISAANDGAYRVSATGKVPGPVRPATVSAVGAVTGSALARALGVAVSGLGYLGIGAALYGLVRDFGGGVDTSGQGFVDTTPVTERAFEKDGETYGTPAEVAAAYYAEMQQPGGMCTGSLYGGTECSGYRLANIPYDASPWVQVYMKDSTCLSNCNAPVHDQVRGWTNHRWYNVARLNGVEVQKTPFAPFDFQAGWARQQHADSPKNLAPAANETIAKTALDLPEPITMSPVAPLPEPQYTEWTTRPRLPSDPLTGSDIRTREKYTPRVGGNGSVLEWDRTEQYQSPSGGAVVDGATQPGGSAAPAPSQSGGVELGDVPVEVTPAASREVSMQRETVALASGCPADIPLIDGNVLSFAQACDAAQKMRPFVLAAATLAALMIALAAIRGAS